MKEQWKTDHAICRPLLQPSVGPSPPFVKLWLETGKEQETSFSGCASDSSFGPAWRRGEERGRGLEMARTGDIHYVHLDWRYSL